MSSPPDRAGQTIALPNGRRIGYAAYGASEGPVVFALHGVPACGLGFAILDPAATRLGIRVVAPDRPGVRHSDRRPGFSVADHVQDLAGLADVLGVDRFGVIGWSGGGPYALAAAALVPERLNVLTVASMPPATMPDWKKTLNFADRAGLLLARRAPKLGGRLLAAVSRNAGKNPAKAAERFAKELCPSDRLVAAGGPPE